MLVRSKINYIRSPIQTNDTYIVKGSGVGTGLRRLVYTKAIGKYIGLLENRFSDVIKKATKRKAQWPFLRLPL